jgi:hypothetical protein
VDDHVWTDSIVDDDGGMEADGIYGNPLDDLLRFEGEYTFHAVATYDDGCAARREVMWSLHVDPGIDPGRTDVRLVASADGSGTIRMTPNDRYGNPLGPGRSPLFDVTGQPGTQVTGPVVDNGDGSYAVPVSWDPGAPGGPGIVVSQPERDPVPIAPSAVSGVDRLRWLPWVLLALVIALVIVILIVLLVS